MKITYDAGVDAVSIMFVDKPRSVETIEISDHINADYDSRGKLVAMEILDASKVIGGAEVKKLPATSNELTLQEAAKESKLEAATLRSLINKGRLKGRKHGRDWLVELADLFNYLESRDPRGGGKKRELARAS